MLLDLDVFLHEPARTADRRIWLSLAWWLAQLVRGLADSLGLVLRNVETGQARSGE
jgi:hypothetical protein